MSNKLFKSEIIQKSKLVIGRRYVCNCNKFHIATWNGVGFEHEEVRFGMPYKSTEFHKEDGGSVEPVRGL